MFQEVHNRKSIFFCNNAYNFFSYIDVETILYPEFNTPKSQISHHISSKYNRIFTERSFQKLNSWFVEFYV